MVRNYVQQKYDARLFHCSAKKCFDETWPFYIKFRNNMSNEAGTQVFKHRCSSSDINNDAESHILLVAQNMNNYLSTNLISRSYLD